MAEDSAIISGSPEAGAVPETQTAETAGNQGEATSGADTHTATAEGQASQANEINTQEGAASATEGNEEGKASHQTTLEERVQQLAEKRIAEVETKLTAKLNEVTQAKAAEKPNFYEVDFDKVNNYFREATDKIEELKFEGKYLDAMEIQDNLTGMRQMLKQNEQNKAEYVQKMNTQQQSAQQMDQLNQKITEASDLVRKESGMTPEVWKAGEEFFGAERAAKPLIDAQFREKVMIQGPVAALLWAKDYVEQNMGKKEQDLIDKKEAAKTALPPGKTSTGASDIDAKLAALKVKAGSGNAEDLAAYMAAKNTQHK